MDDKKFLQLAINQSKISFKKGKFPAGAVVAKGTEVLSEGISDSSQHAEFRAIDIALQKQSRLSGATLYVSMEPCSICLKWAYWSGIRRIIYAIAKEKLNQKYYEGEQNNSEIIASFGEPIEYIQVSEFEDGGLDIVKKWEKI